MSKRTDKFENDIVKILSCHTGEKIPKQIPKWMIELGIKPDSTIINVERIGNKDHSNKTDVIIFLENSENIKISVKLLSADYFGNWYGHKRFISEFGTETFNKMTKAATIWANNWLETTKTLFVGVSICFGKRKGKTGQNFLDIFDYEDILKVVKGIGDGDNVANCLYISDSKPKNLEELFNILEPITVENVLKATEEFKVAYRPINPETEFSNRGKNVYTKYQPYEKLEELTEIKTVEDLRKYGHFIEVKPNCLNHNHILNELEDKYNIIIKRKQKEN